MPVLNMSYDDIHRYFLRTIASRGVMTTAQAEEVIAKYPGEEPKPSIINLVSLINSKIKAFQQAIKISTNESTGEEVIIFLQLGQDETAKVQGFFTAVELDYFRILIEQIVTTNNRQIQGIMALNLVSKVKSTFSKTDAQRLLSLWCRMHYLDKINNAYALGVRAVHEFESYLRQNMPDTIEDCTLCKLVVFRGSNCPGCGIAVHTRCLNKYLENINKWPCCSANFNQDQLNSTQNESMPEEPETISQVYDTLPDQAMDTSEEANEDLTQESNIGISQTAAVKNRKRKRACL